VEPSLVFISGASSGIGLALARTVPWSPARVVNISRREQEGLEHVQADLADPVGWTRVVELFENEIPDFDGPRVVFVHCAGTIEPIGFAGEVDPARYTREVLLNSASPQVLGDAFLRAARRTAAPSHLLMISSGAARTVYEGWSAYGAGKAAVDQWVRTAGAEQARRGGRCRILSVAPGVVETEMQGQIRRMSPEDFPGVQRFRELKEQGLLRDPTEAARDLWTLLDRDLENGAVIDLRKLAPR
jgi:NAD(P)-dependent dehydrogenase (short-subunit alcohol dehydrogenase family)